MRDAGAIPQADAIAFFLTWTAYGSWLPGDDRGWVDGTGQVRLAEPLRKAVALRRMAEGIVLLDVDQRVAVEDAIVAHARLRGWHLHGVACRRQHVHVVVSAVSRSPHDVMQQFKSWATRKLEALAAGRGMRCRRRWWTEGGSRRRVFCDGDLAAVVAYVLECQGVPASHP